MRARRGTPPRDAPPPDEEEEGSARALSAWAIASDPTLLPGETPAPSDCAGHTLRIYVSHFARSACRPSVRLAVQAVDGDDEQAMLAVGDLPVAPPGLARGASNTGEVG